MVRISTIQYVDRIAEEIAVIANETTARKPSPENKKQLDSILMLNKGVLYSIFQTIFEFNANALV